MPSIQDQTATAGGQIAIPPSARPPMSTLKFTCDVCLDTKKLTCRRKIASDEICRSCFRQGVQPLFHKALQFESQYPPKWGETILYPDDFVQDLGADFVKRYRAREREYNTSFQERVYCRNMVTSQGSKLIPGQTQKTTSKGREGKVECGAFCGQKVLVRPDGPARRVKCTSCSGFPCEYCGMNIEAVKNKNKSATHICQHASTDHIDVSAALTSNELKRGKDFQICPNPTCKAPVQLKDGCNFMKCHSCSEGFCYICGQGGLKDQDGHWRMGMPCPRYKQPGPRAVRDGFGADVPRPERDVGRVRGFAARLRAEGYVPPPIPVWRGGGQ